MQTEFADSILLLMLTIDKVIDIGLNTPDPKVRNLWEAIPHKGNRPSPEDVVNCLAVMTTMQRNAENPAFFHKKATALLLSFEGG